MITKMETECLCLAVKEMAETVLKMAEISQMDEEWRKETASAIGLTAELAIRMIASASSGERSESEALFWASFFGGKGKSLLPEYWWRNAGRLLSWAEDEKTDYEPSFTINGGTKTSGRTTPVTSVTKAMDVSYNNRLVAFLPTGIARSMGMSAMLAVSIVATGTAVVLVMRRKKKM